MGQAALIGPKFVSGAVGIIVASPGFARSLRSSVLLRYDFMEQSEDSFSLCSVVESRYQVEKLDKSAEYFP